ncbi:fimbrial protein [Providencia rettgeri]
MKLSSVFNRKTLLSTILVSGGILSNMSIAAVPDGKISFIGSIRDATCIIEGGNTEGGATTKNNFTVNMPVANVADFRKINDRAGSTSFFIRLKGENCLAGEGYAIKFESLNNAEFIDTATGYLRNMKEDGNGGAKGVQLVITDEVDNDFDFKKSENISPKKTRVENQDTQFDFTVNYISIKENVAPGAVEGNLLYSVVYP